MKSYIITILLFVHAIIFFKTSFNFPAFSLRKTIHVSQILAHVQVEQSKQVGLSQEKIYNELVWKNGLLFVLAALTIISCLIIRRQRLQLNVYHKEQNLAKVELENVRRQEAKLKEELESAHKKLTSYSLNFIQKNGLMEALKINIDLLKKAPHRENMKELNRS